MIIERFYQNLAKQMTPKRVLVIYGPRRAGKTTLLGQFLQGTNFKHKLESGASLRVRQVLNSQDFRQISDFVAGYQLIVIDEAQYIPKVGAGLKIIADEHPEVRLIATGSSSFDLSQQVGEPLTGRKWTITLYPLAQMELAKLYNHYELKGRLEEFLLFGSYPEVVTAKSKKAKIKILRELSESYLLKDILALEQIKNSQVLLNLLKLLAFQVGQLVSMNELATQLHINIRTVERYLDLLEKTFVIYGLGGYSRNLRKTISQKKKYYFLDNGVRNALISQFNSLDLRDDAGQLWENFLVSERLKKQEYKNIRPNNYFWRTWEGQEVDWVEEQNGALRGFEFKWGDGKKVKQPKDWKKTYKKTSFQVINKENYLDFLV
jgi:predicted AAA+ superfamily ATPase